MTVIPAIQDFDDKNYDPFTDTSTFGEKPANFWEVQTKAWNENGPVQRGDFRELSGLPRDISTPPEQPSFLVFGASRIRQVLNDDSTNKDHHKNGGFRAAFGNSLTQMNPPEHTLYRKIFQKIFLPGVIQQWSTTLVEPVIEELIQKFKPLGKTEIIEAFTFPYPFEIIYRQLQLPRSDIRTFHKLAVAQVFFALELEKATEAGRKLGVYFQALLDERRRNPGDDMISMLAQAEADGERLPDDVIVSFLRQLINAAGDTTYRSTSSMLVCLLHERPDQYQMIVNDHSLIPAAVEETLRLYAPVLSSARTTTREIEIDGVKIPPGAIVQCATSLVGRDPELFENPDAYDLTRPHPERHMAFSNGPHICLGQHLARLEMKRALAALVTHFPRLRLDKDYPPPVIMGAGMIAPHRIYVRFD